MAMITKAKIRGSLKSLTIWFNGALLVALPVAEYLKSVLPEVQQYVDADTYKAIGAVVVVANILLRFRTATGLDNK